MGLSQNISVQRRNSVRSSHILVKNVQIATSQVNWRLTCCQFFHIVGHADQPPLNFDFFFPS